jgi:hypothetical protein
MADEREASEADDVSVDGLEDEKQRADDEQEEALLEGGVLLPRVRELLTRIPSTDERGKYERFFKAAAAAIERLGELDVTGVVEDSETANQDVWNALEPTVKKTFRRVDAFLDVVKREFGMAVEDSNDEPDLDFDLGGEESAAKPSEEPEDAGDDVKGALGAYCSNMLRELKMLQAKLPELMKDRWNLLEQLGEFRGRARSGVGEMVFLSARQFAMVRKEDVVPFYKEDIDSSVQLRRAISQLRGRIEVHRTHLGRLDVGKDANAVKDTIKKFVHEFDVFMKNDSWRGMRAIDKRSFLQVRREVGEAADREKLAKREVETTVEGLSRFLDSLSHMNRRELLVVHDRETIAGTQRHLDAVITAVGSADEEAARAAFKRAYKDADRLFGREATLDGILKLFTRVEPDKLELSELLEMAQLLRAQL